MQLLDHHQPKPLRPSKPLAVSPLFLDGGRTDVGEESLWLGVSSAAESAGAQTGNVKLYLVDQCTWRQPKKDGGHIDGSVDLVGAVEIVGQNNTKVSLPCFVIEAKVGLVDAHPQLCG